MPIDPSIPLQAKNPQIEVGANQLAMMNEALKFNEMNRSIEEQNRLNQYLQGADLSKPEARQELVKYGKTGLAYGKALNEQDLSAANLKKTNVEVDQKTFDLVKQKMADLAFNPSDNNIKAHLEDGILRKEVTPQQAQATWQAVSALPLDKRSAYFTNLGMKAAERAQLAETTRSHKVHEGIAYQNLNKPQYMQTDAGLVALPNVLKPGQAPVGTMVTGPNGENLGRPLKEIPATVNKAITENQIALNKINRALDLNAGKEITLPSGDKIQGSTDATGFIKGLTPQVILNSWDPKGVDTRAFIADIGSLKVHDRSGAAVTASETPRLKPFIPSITDSPDVAAKKLAQFKAEYEDIQNSFAEMYSKEQGYRPSPALTNKGSNPVQPMYATNGTQRIVSNDGGATWQPVGAK